MENKNIVNCSVLTSVLESLAVGDAFGMPTEFMTREEIKQQFGIVNRLLVSSESKNHSNLAQGQITDDTEQNFYLIDEYQKTMQVDVKNTTECLLRWVKETDAIGKKYIGPSSMKALLAIEEGKNPFEAGINGTTCGGIMRTPALVLCSNLSKEQVTQNVYLGCVPTHHTSQAIEAAMAYGYALRTALLGEDFDTILKEAMEGAEVGLNKANYIACASSSGKRIADLMSRMSTITSDEQLLDLLYYVYGTGLESDDICAAVFGIFMYVKGDVFRGIELAASVGGDTDTIACLVGALSAAYAKEHNIPDYVVEKVITTNQLKIDELVEAIERFMIG